MERRNWTHEELLLAINLYFTLPYGRLHSGTPEIIKLAEVIGRTPSAVAMKLVNFASLDPQHQARGVKGLSNVSQADRAAWAEFVGQGQEIALTNTVSEEVKKETEAVRLTKVRTVQSYFRRNILSNYQERCCVCGLPVASLLIASHIKRWNEFIEGRLDPTNGLCLCALHDKAFDTYFLTVTPDYRVKVSNKLNTLFADERSIENYFTIFENKPITLPVEYPPKPEYLSDHYIQFEEKERV